MSGICGIVRLDGGGPSPAEIAAMSEVLQRRGPDGTGTWVGGCAALGHTLLATTPEALVERLPMTHADSGCTITADVRLDNREELLAALGLSGETRVIGDGELVLLAYLRWGEDCPKHLLGDFAFAIWDERSQQLFCARDHMGMRQFNYCHIPGQMFVFSTEDTGVLAHPAVPKNLNEGRIADFLADLDDYDITSTFFEAVQRLPPAHSLSVGPRTCEIRRYWTLRAPSMPRLETGESPADAFLTVFTEAVRVRLRGNRVVGAMLSGGLDSSAVVAISASILAASGQGPLCTISAVAPDAANCPETEAIRTALSIDGLHPIFVSLADLDGIGDQLKAALWDTDNPFELNGTMLRCIYAAARRNGIKVVLDGGSGDVILTSNNRLASLLSAGRVGPAIREVVGQIKFWKPDKPLTYTAVKMTSAAWVAFAPLAIRSWWRRLRILRKPPATVPGLAERVGFADRRRHALRHLRVLKPGDPQWRTQAILHPNLVTGRERYDQLAGSMGVEPRDPFMDIRVIEFCLSLPAEQIESGGWPKILLRRALASRVPGTIAWRRGKEHLGGDFTRALLADWKDWPDSMCDRHSPLGRYLSHSAMRDLREHRNDPPTGPRLSFFALDRFLRRYGG
jgi:asparagine synthase (glutamine-hydrolysing)